MEATAPLPVDRGLERAVEPFNTTSFVVHDVSRPGGSAMFYRCIGIELAHRYHQRDVPETRAPAGLYMHLIVGPATDPDSCDSPPRRCPRRRLGGLLQWHECQS